MAFPPTRLNSTAMSTGFLSALRQTTRSLLAMRFTRGALALAVMLVAACSDAPTAPTPGIDRVAAARVMPSVTDARVRLAPSIQNPPLRDRARHDSRVLRAGHRDRVSH